MTDISKIVNAKISIESEGLLRRDFGIGLYLTTEFSVSDQVVDPTVGKLKRYASIADVIVDYPEGSDVANAAAIWFQKVPAPKNLMVGQYAKTAQKAYLSSGTVDIEGLKAITSGTMTINSKNLTGLNFSGVTNIEDVRNVLNAALSGATAEISAVMLSENTIYLETDTAGAFDATQLYGVPSGQPGEVATLLAIGQGQAKAIKDGVNAETITECMDALVAIDPSFYFICESPEISDTDDVIELAKWTQPRKYMYFAESSQLEALMPGESSSLLYQLWATGNTYDRTATHWTASDPTDPALQTVNLNLSAAAALSSVNFSAADSLINPKFKSCPGIEAADLTVTQATELDRKLVNRYVPVGGGTTSPNIVDIYVEGWTAKNGVFQDVRYAIDWLVNALQVDVFDLLVRAPLLPQDDSGSNAIVDTMSRVLAQAVRNGMVAPGTVSPALKQQIIATTGNTDFNGVLPKGYVIYPEPWATQSQSDRDQRKSVPIHLWIKGAGAINSVEIIGIFEQ